MSVICLLLAACGGNDETPTPAPATATAVPTVAEPTEAPAETATEAPAASTEVTSTEEVSSTGDVSATTETTSTEEVAPSEEVSATTETTSTEEVAPSEEMTATTETTSTEEVAPSEEVTASEETTSTEEVAPSEEVTATEETTSTSSSESTTAAPAGPITVLSDRQLTEVLDENYPYFPTLSPDGSAIVYATQHRRDRSLCVYTFENADVNCTTPPEEFQDYPYALQWSPDSKLIAFTENPLQLANESDIWIYDVAAGTYTDITDDGVNGYYRGESGYTLDYLPMWNKADGELYFWRSVPDNATLTATRVLMKINASGGEPEVVRDLTSDTAQELITFDSEYWFLSGVSDLSPQGDKIAYLLTAPSDPYNSGDNGLWLVDLSTPDSTPKQLMTMDQFQAASAPFQNLPATPVGLSWTGDGKAVVAAAFSNDTHSPLQVFYYVDVESGEITPVVDFSQVPDLETLYGEPDEAGLPMRYYSPWAAVISPSGNSLLMYNDLGGVPGMLQATLPPTGKPVAIYKGENSSTGMGTRASSGSDGKVLIYGEVLTTEQP